LQRGVAGQIGGNELALQFIAKSFKGNNFVALARPFNAMKSFLVHFRPRILINAQL